MQLSQIVVYGITGAILNATAPVAASEIEVSRNEAGASYLSISGKIEKDDVKTFTEIAMTSKADMVFLESPGGSIEAAIEIGRVIRLKGMTTIVTHSDYCASACGLIWLAGARRILTSGARVGFHATYTTKDNVRFESGVGNALVGRYLTLLNLPERAIVFATVAGPETLNWLDVGKRRTSGIEFETPEANVNDRPVIAAAARTPALTMAALDDEPELLSLQN